MGKAERLLHGVRFDVERVQIAPDVYRERVVHPGAVIVLPVLDDGRIVMIRNHRFVVDEWLWELCAGTLEPDEPPHECAARELIEETGYQAALIEPLTSFYTSPGFSNELMYAFLATGLTHVGQQLEATEKIEVELLPLNDVMSMVRDGRIRDGKSIATLLYYHTWRRNVVN